MNYYVVQVHTGNEDKFLTGARRDVDRELGSRSLQGYGGDSSDESTATHFVPRLHWPRRRLYVRRKGRTQAQIQPIFPGYVFLEAPEVTDRLYWILRSTPGFVRILRDNQNIQPLSARDTQLVLHFLGFGEIAGMSRVTFDRNSRIQVVDGPLAGLEGRIVKVDKRKRRAKVRLDLYDDSFLIDFGFEDMAQVAQNSGV